MVLILTIRKGNWSSSVETIDIVENSVQWLSADKTLIENSAKVMMWNGMKDVKILWRLGIIKLCIYKGYYKKCDLPCWG